MGGYNVAIATPRGVDQDEAVASAMAPYRGVGWDWYAIGGYDFPQVYAHIGTDGQWLLGPPPDGVPVVIVRCKG